MANQSISQLNKLTIDALAANDPLAIVDVSASETKKIEAKDLVQGGLSLVDANSIDLAKLNQASTVKIDTTAIASDAINAAKFADNSSIICQSTTPVVNEAVDLFNAFSGRGFFRTTDNNLFIYSTGTYQQVVMPTDGIADAAVTTAKIATNAVTDTKIQSGGLGTSSIADSAITLAKIAASGVGTTQLVDLSVTTAKLGNSSITSGKFAAGAVDTAAIGSNVITSDKFFGGAVDTAALGASAVTNAKIADATIAYAKLNLTDGDIPATKITSATISGLQIASQGVLTGNIADLAVTNAKIADATIEAGKLAADAVTTSNIADDAITAAKIGDGEVGTAALADDNVTADKLSDNSSSVVQPNGPVGNGAFAGQQWFDSSTGIEYCWDGASWIRQAAINTLSFTDTTPLAFSVAYPDTISAIITTSLDDQTANTVFAGPTTGAATTPTFRALDAADLPIATDLTVGAVQPGDGLSVDGAGVINHSNSTAAGTYVGAITIDGQGHIVSANEDLTADEIPDLDASKITTGQFTTDFLAENSVTASQLADYGIAQVSETAPVPEFAGQWWINPNDRAAYIWVGVVAPTPEGYWLNLGYGSPTQINLRFGGTYNASGNIVESINSYGIEAGLSIGQPLSAPSTSNNGVYLIVTSSGVGSSPAPTGNLDIGNWVLSEGVGTQWTKVELTSAVAGIGDQDVLVDGGALNPVASGIASQEDFNETAWGRIQIANLATAGIVRETTEVVVDNSTGEMTIGTVDDGTY